MGSREPSRVAVASRPMLWPRDWGDVRCSAHGGSSSAGRRQEAVIGQEKRGRADGNDGEALRARTGGDASGDRLCLRDLDAFCLRSNT